MLILTFLFIDSYIDDEMKETFPAYIYFEKGKNVTNSKKYLIGGGIVL